MKVRSRGCGCARLRSRLGHCQGDFRVSSGNVSEGKVKTSKVVQHIGEAVQAQARHCAALLVAPAPPEPPRAWRQVNLAKLDAQARMENIGGGRPSKHVGSVQAANLLAARAKLEDALWEPWLRAKVRARRRVPPPEPHVLMAQRADRLAACCCGW